MTAVPSMHQGCRNTAKPRSPKNQFAFRRALVREKGPAPARHAGHRADRSQLLSSGAGLGVGTVGSAFGMRVAAAAASLRVCVPMGLVDLPV